AGRVAQGQAQGSRTRPAAGPAALGASRAACPVRHRPGPPRQLRSAVARFVPERAPLGDPLSEKANLFIYFFSPQCSMSSSRRWFNPIVSLSYRI
ncbi:MAG: hypothetical protein BJ554DRAFT_4799, partial [Olpidium bornovanus]